jgi:hypothetical protein
MPLEVFFTPIFYTIAHMLICITCLGQSVLHIYIFTPELFYNYVLSRTLYMYPPAFAPL